MSLPPHPWMQLILMFQKPKLPEKNLPIKLPDLKMKVPASLLPIKSMVQKTNPPNPIATRKMKPAMVIKTATGMNTANLVLMDKAQVLLMDKVREAKTAAEMKTTNPINTDKVLPAI